MEFLKIPKISTSIAKVILRHSAGPKAELTNFGATLMSLNFPNKFGLLQEVVAGYDDPKYYTQPPYTNFNFCLGASIGRYAGRISGGGFELNGNFYELPTEDGIHLHGGNMGFDKQIWTIVEEHHGDNPYVIFRLLSSDGEGGYPGNLEVEAKYLLTEDSLFVTYSAKTDKETVVNLTNHSYFQLDDTGTVKGKTLFINSESILKVDERLIPLGSKKNIEFTTYDYRSPLELNFEGHNGLDTAYDITNATIAARLYSEVSGIQLEVETNQPCLVVFTPQKFPKLGLRHESNYGRFPAICFECQNFPDAPNQANFPSALLRPEETYRNEMRYRFTTP